MSKEAMKLALGAMDLTNQGQTLQGLRLQDGTENARNDWRTHDI